MTTSCLPRFAAADKVNDICCTRNIIETGNTPLSRFASLSVPCFIQIGKVLLTYYVQHILIMQHDDVRMITDKIHALLLNVVLPPCPKIQKQNARTNVAPHPQTSRMTFLVDVRHASNPVVSHIPSVKFRETCTTNEITIKINNLGNIGQQLGKQQTVVRRQRNMRRTVGTCLQRRIPKLIFFHWKKTNPRAALLRNILKAASVVFRDAPVKH